MRTGVRGIVEHKDATPYVLDIREINSGIYAFDAAVLSNCLSRLSTDNAQGELYLTDVLGMARTDGRRVGAHATNDSWQTEGVNDRVQLAALHRELNRRVLERWMRAGVTVIDPATTWVDVTVKLGRDVVLRPGVQLHGSTTVDDGAEIGPDSTLVDCVVGAGERRADARQRSRDRPRVLRRSVHVSCGRARLARAAKAGAFVEIKASTGRRRCRTFPMSATRRSGPGATSVRRR